MGNLSLAELAGSAPEELMANASPALRAALERHQTEPGVVQGAFQSFLGA